MTRTTTTPPPWVIVAATLATAHAAAAATPRDYPVKPVPSTSELRLEVTLPPQWSAGIQEWKVR